MKTIEIMERENLAYLAQVKGEKFLKGLQDLMQEHPILGYVEGKGLYIGVEFVKDRNSKKPATEETKWMTLRLLQKGMRCGSRLPGEQVRPITTPSHTR